MTSGDTKAFLRYQTHVHGELSRQRVNPYARVIVNAEYELTYS